MRNGYTYGLELEYRYCVAGENFTGNRWSYTVTESSDKWPQRVSNAYQRGTPITVYYNSADPSEAVIEAGLTGTEPLVAMLIMPFNLIVLVSWQMLLRAVQKDDWRTAGNVAVTDEGHRLRVRLPQWSPKLTAGAALAASSIAGALLIVFPAGSHPPLSYSLLIWTGTFVVAGYVYWRMRRPIESGDVDLIYDRANRSIQRPATFGRKVCERLPWSSIVDVAPEIDERRDRRNRITRCYFTNVAWQTGEHKGSARIMQWGTAQEAEEFSCWLKQQLSLA